MQMISMIVNIEPIREPCLSQAFVPKNAGHTEQQNTHVKIVAFINFSEKNGILLVFNECDLVTTMNDK